MLVLIGASGKVYPGGGYVQDLSDTLQESLLKVSKLNLTGWMDSRTRAIIVEFYLFNVHSSLFALVSIVVECLANGVYTTRIYVSLLISINKCEREGV